MVAYFDGYNKVYNEIKGADDTFFNSLIHPLRMAFYDTFEPMHSGVYSHGFKLREWDQWAETKKNTSNIKEKTILQDKSYWRVFLGIRSEDYKSDGWGPLYNVGRFAENLLKLVTEFPVTLVDYYIEKAWAHLIDDVLNSLLNSSLSKPAKIVSGILLAPVVMAVGFSHVAMKIGATAVRLVTSHEKMWAEADYIGTWVGRAARVATVGLIIGACIGFPPLAAKLGPLFGNTFVGSALSGISKGVLSLGSALGVTATAAASISGVVLSVFVASKDIAKKARGYIKNLGKDKNDDMEVRSSEMISERDSFLQRDSNIELASTRSSVQGEDTAEIMKDMQGVESKSPLPPVVNTNQQQKSSRHNVLSDNAETLFAHNINGANVAPAQEKRVEEEMPDEEVPLLKIV